MGFNSGFKGLTCWQLQMLDNLLCMLLLRLTIIRYSAERFPVKYKAHYRRFLGLKDVEASRISIQSTHEGGEVVSPTHRNIACTEGNCDMSVCFFTSVLYMTSHWLYRSLVICIHEVLFSPYFFEVWRWLIHYTTIYRTFLSEVYFTYWEHLGIWSCTRAEAVFFYHNSGRHTFYCM